MEKQMNTLIDVLRWRAEQHPNKINYTFLLDGEKEEVSWTYQQVDQRARAIAAELQAQGLQGQRAILLYIPGLDYIAGFLGCLYAGVIAVPIYPLDPNRLERTLPRFRAVIQDSQSEVILTTQMIQTMGEFLLNQAPDLKALRWIATDQVSIEQGSHWQDPSISATDLAFLQYTSGSTGEPKGVMLSHQNLMYNMELIQQSFEIKEEDSSVIWLPPYHDMGLIGGILGSLYSGITTVLMSPLDFLQRPLRWLQAISKYHTTMSGGPNFAYELCIQKTTPEQRAKLDLSSWTLAFSGAEPILPETLKRFVEAFSPCGFKREAFYPCYGLAEGTLIVSGGKRAELPKLKGLSKAEFRTKQISQSAEGEQDLTLVSCGRDLPGQTIKIARPDTHQLCPEGEVGEIWLQGGSVAQGYWQQPEKSKEVFQAYLKESFELLRHSRAGGNPELVSTMDSCLRRNDDTNAAAGPFLRTGDLGFMQAGELFVTGRLKDLIIIRGANHYPQDIERNIDQVHPAIRSGCSAAFSVKVGLEEKLVLVMEIDSKLITNPENDLPPIYDAIKKVVALEHALEVYAIALVKKGGVPKTSSGKIRRSNCREEYLLRNLEIFDEYRQTPRATAKVSVETSSEVTQPNPEAIPNNTKQMLLWLKQNLAEHLGVASEEIDPKKSFAEYGLDSKDAVNLSGELEDLLECHLPPTLLWKYPNIDSLAGYLMSQDAPA